MTTTPPAPTAVIVAVPADDLEVVATLGTDVITYLEAEWHRGACGCLMVDGSCVTYGQRWNDYAPVTWMPDAVIIALREVVTAQQAEATERAAA